MVTGDRRGITSRVATRDGGSEHALCPLRSGYLQGRPRATSAVPAHGVHPPGEGVGDLESRKANQ